MSASDLRLHPDQKLDSDDVKLDPRDLPPSTAINVIEAADDDTYLELMGYKQEFRREFSGLEVRLYFFNINLSNDLCVPSDVWYRLQYHRLATLNSVSRISLSDSA